MSLWSYLAPIISTANYITPLGAGIDISSATLKYVQFSSTGFFKEGLKLAGAGELPIGTGTIHHGRIKDHTKLVAALEKVKNEGGLEYVRVSLPGEGAYLFEIELKKDASFKEIRGVLNFHLEENVPPADDVVLGYEIIEDNLKTQHLRVLVTAYNHDLLRGYYEACLKAGLVPLSFEIDMAAISRAAISQCNRGTYMIVDFGKQRSRIGIIHNGVLSYITTIQIGDSNLSLQLQKKFGTKSESKITEFKCRRGLIKSFGKNSGYEVIIGPVSILASEIIVQIYSWHKRNSIHGEKTIQELVLCGEGASLQGLPEYLTNTLNIPTSRAQVWQNAFSPDSALPAIDCDDSYSYAAAIGLALTGFIETDL